MVPGGAQSDLKHASGTRCCERLVVYDGRWSRVGTEQPLSHAAGPKLGQVHGEQACPYPWLAYSGRYRSLRPSVA